MSTAPNRYEHYSDETRAFFADYQSWLDAGAPDMPEEIFVRSYEFQNRGEWTALVPYTRLVGLCHNAGLYNTSVSEEIRQVFHELYPPDYLDRINVVDSVYPFGGELRYRDDRDNHTQHMNQQRNAWVKVNLPTLYEAVEDS